jgi:hypothetical protein
MKRPNLFVVSLASMVGLVAYVFAVSWIMSNGERIFGSLPNVFGPTAFLLLFILSATITSSLFLGYPLYLYLDGKKKEALRLFAYNLATLFALTFVYFAGLMAVLWFVPVTISN